MNRKIYLIVVLTVMISLFSGTTYSFFTDSSAVDEVILTTGRHEVKIIENSLNRSIDSVDGADFSNWKPGKENAIFISWRFANSGDQDSNYRVDIKAEWANESNNAVHWVQTGDDKWIEDELGGKTYRYPEIVSPGEEVELSFGVWCESISGVEDSDYFIELEVESFQVQ